MALYSGPQPLSLYGDFTTSGLFGKKYVGNYAGNPAFFATATLEGTTETRTNLSFEGVGGDNFSWMWVGYFKPTTTETYTFTLFNIDDYADLWLGPSAVRRYTTANKLASAAVGSGSGSIALTANTYYPMRVTFGESGGYERFILRFSTPTITQRTDGSGYYFGGSSAWSRFGAL